MAFTAPYVPTANDLITAQGLTDNADALRLYVNQGMNIGDIVATYVSTQCIVEGEPFGVVPGHQFLSGDQHHIFVPGEQEYRTYMTGTDTSVTDLTGVDRAIPVPNTGKHFVAESEGFYLYHAWMMVIVPAESLGASTTVDPGTQMDLYLYHKESPTFGTELNEIEYSRTSFFIEDAAYTATASGFTNPSVIASPANRRYFPIHYFGTFSKGDHVDICVYASCRTERAYVSARSVYIETFYL